MNKEAKKVLESIKKGEDQLALNYLYKTPLRKVRRYILNNSGTREDADDIFQDAVIVLFDYVLQNKFKEEYDLDGFLFRVAKNAWINKVKKKDVLVRSETLEIDTDNGVDYLQDIIKKEQLEAFHQVFNQLQENCKKLLTYVVFDQKSMKEVAVLLGMKDEKVVKSQHYRCKKYLIQLAKQEKNLLKFQ